MIKYLYANSSLFRAYINKIAFNGQKHTQAELVESFVDSNGLKYFQYKNHLEIPVVRLGKLQDFHFQLSRKLDKDELALFIEAMRKLMVNVLANASHMDRAVKHLAKIQVVLDDMVVREEQLLHPELLFDIVACLYIREDENPAEFNESLHNEKVKQFKLDSVGGLYDFFYNAGIQRYFIGFELLREDFNGLWEFSKASTQAKNEALSQMASL